MIVRANPDTPCQPNDAHHPHRYHCDDPDCCGPENWRENGVGEFVWLGKLGLECCVCGQDWPCATKRQHVVARASAHAAADVMGRLLELELQEE